VLVHGMTSRGMGLAETQRRKRQNNLPPLPATVLDHLGQKLRATYYEISDRPKYVGDTALPVEFDPYLYRLVQKDQAARIERTETAGLAAVAVALGTMPL